MSEELPVNRPKVAKPDEVYHAQVDELRRKREQKAAEKDRNGATETKRRRQ